MQLLRTEAGLALTQVEMLLVLLPVMSSLVRLEPGLLDAFSVPGASAWMTFRRVVLPSIRSGVLAGAVLVSLDNLPVLLFLGSAQTDMLPIRMWGMMENSLDVRVAAISGLLVGFSFVVLLLMDRIAGLTSTPRTAWPRSCCA